LCVEENRNLPSPHIAGQYDADLHINHCPDDGKEWPPQNDNDLGAILQIQQYKITWDEELAHLN